MDTIENQDDIVIELGIASIETKGPPRVGIDSLGGAVTMGGISDD